MLGMKTMICIVSVYVVDPILLYHESVSKGSLISESLLWLKSPVQIDKGKECSGHDLAYFSWRF